MSVENYIRRRKPYVSPEVEALDFPQGLSVLAYFSAEADFEDFEEGDEL